MERLTIDEIIEHCERTIQRFESFSSREKCEKWNVDTQYGKEYWEHRQVKEYLEELKRYRGLEGQGFPSKAFEKLLHNIHELREVVTCDEDAEWNRALFECTKIVHSIAEEYADGWIPCTLIDHPDDAYDCEVTTLQNGEYIRDIGFYTDKWRRLSDETPILVVAWKEPSTPYQPK